MRVLLVEDDPILGDGLQAGLRQAGYTVDWMKDGRDALAALQTDPFAAVVLDLGLPGMDGYEVLRALRATGNATPVLILTARDTVRDKVAGLDGGADDYLVKPFELDELFARLRALLRRRGGRPLPTLQIGDLEINAAEHRVIHEGRPIELSPKEFAILQELMENAGRVISRASLETALYGWEDELSSNAVEVYIHNLRKKLGPDSIRTLRGVGYVISKPE